MKAKRVVKAEKLIIAYKSEILKFRAYVARYKASRFSFNCPIPQDWKLVISEESGPIIHLEHTIAKCHTATKYIYPSDIGLPRYNETEDLERIIEFLLPLAVAEAIAIERGIL